jgi:XamI restriction endonuclease
LQRAHAAWQTCRVEIDSQKELPGESLERVAVIGAIGRISRFALADRAGTGARVNAGRQREAASPSASTCSINNISEAPEVGTFCSESPFGSRKADLIVRLYDGRVMPTEAKVSNSSTNSVKRLNNDAAVKARQWTQEFGTRSVVPVAVLGGVFKLHNLRSAQDQDGLTIFWAHDLDAMIEFVERTRL